MATIKNTVSLYGAELPDAFDLNKLIKQSSSACDKMIVKANDLDRQIKATMKEIRYTTIPSDASDEEVARIKAQRKSLTDSKNAMIREKNINLASAKAMEVNADAYGDVYRAVTGEEPANHRKTERLQPYQALSEDELKDMVDRVWGDTKKKVAKKVEAQSASSPVTETVTAEVVTEAASAAAVETAPATAAETVSEEVKAESTAEAVPEVSSEDVAEVVSDASVSDKDVTDARGEQPEKRVSAGILIVIAALIAGFAYLGTFMF